MRADPYSTVAKAIQRLCEAAPAPSLEDLARDAGLTPSRFRRVFGAWAGVSPLRFGQLISTERARLALARGPDLLEARQGLSGPGPLHDLVVTCEAIAPAPDGGAGVEIRFGTGQTPFGRALVGVAGQGLCHLAFVDGHDRALARLASAWPGARMVADDPLARRCLERAFDRGRSGPRPLHLYLRGSNFQLRVWQALMRIPSGRIVSYSNLARLIGAPRAARAVGAAVGANPIAFLVPCHRVILGSGLFGQYRWGTGRKTAMIGWEAARHAGEQLEAVQDGHQLG